jgi:hypothetical protein
MVLMIAPITLGAGKRLFGDGTPAGSMKLVEQRTGAGGMLMATYEPAGALESGSIGPDRPTERELRRRARVAAGDW